MTLSQGAEPCRPGLNTAVVMAKGGMQVDGCFADPTQYNVTYPGLGFALNKTGRGHGLQLLLASIPP